MTINIRLKENLEEIIHYPDSLWQHIMLHTQLDQTILGYIPLHWHNDLQLMVVTCGTIQIEIANQTVVLKKDQALFINTNVVHKIEGLEADTSFYCWNIGLPDATDYVNYKYVNQIINTLDKHYQLNILSEYYICLKYLVMLIDQTHHSKQYYYFDQRIKDCINFIHRN